MNDLDYQVEMIVFLRSRMIIENQQIRELFIKFEFVKFLYLLNTSCIFKYKILDRYNLYNIKI